MASVPSNNLERIRRLESKVRELSFLHETSQLLTATLDLDSVLHSLMTQVRDYFQVEAVSVALLDQESVDGKGPPTLTFRVAVGGTPEAITGLRLPLDEGIAGWVTREGKPILISDAYGDERFYSGIDEKTGFQTQAVLATPIKIDQETIGAIEALNPTAGTLDEHALEVLNQVADQAALAIHNAELYERAGRAERRYERLFHGSPVPVIVMDLSTEILDVNQKAVELMGQPADELIGSRWRDLLGEEQGVGPPTAISPATDTAETLFETLPENGEKSAEMRMPSPSGPRTLSVHMTAIDYGGQRAIQWIGHDITELAELERMRDDLMHMIVHDLQNPLSNVVGSLQMMHQALREEDSSFPILDVLQVAMRSSKRLRRLIDSLLDLRQLEEGKADLSRILVPPKLLAREAIDLVRPVIEKKKQALTVDIPTGLPPVSVDRDMITRVLTNLLDNAAKFTPTKGEIALTVEQEEASLLFIVSDNGLGISPEAQSCIFERFTRLESARGTKGTGLGLPFCKLAVEAHGGDIWVDSTPGEGSRFTFRLPLEVE
jgi:PAS domain S-box-containing protein